MTNIYIILYVHICKNDTEMHTSMHVCSRWKGRCLIHGTSFQKWPKKVKGSKGSSLSFKLVQLRFSQEL